ncbi:hypothetical protein [Sphingomonas turrisvirgatae]|uniref:Uncharacterized protein n=1 Tax=Sphingomonas turrisvirgatae TaxID=1888892 RepID=A0A1E3LZV0_9SPHN|nr:hypothetical protein [Sphingomonas turrisvirgatae]ODP39253.1 hypothetical protein BFL28_10595 [Sphingomonas turrisvirgatae]
MCDPGTLLIAATATQAIGTGVSALQAAGQSRYEAKVAERNAQLENESARNAEDRRKIEAQRQYRKLSQVQGQQQAAMAANGIDQGFGSALQVQRDTASMGAQDVQSIYDASAQEIRGFDINASNYRAKARGARMQATGALVKGALDVGSTVLGGAQRYAKYKAS